MATEESRDGDGSTAVVRRVVRHLVHCRACRTSLDDVSGKSDAVAFLEAQRDDRSVTTVDRVLGSTATAGKLLLADLVYELAKGCLLSDEQFAKHVKAVAKPREPSVVAQQLELTSERLGHLGLIELPEACRSSAEQASSEEFVAAGQAFLELLHQLEGKSLRHELVVAHELMLREKSSEAVGRLEVLLDRTSSLDPSWHSVAEGLACGLVRLDRNDECEALLAKAFAQRNASPVLQLYGVLNAVVMGDRSVTTKRMDAFSAQEREWDHSQEGVVELMADVIASELGASRTEVGQRLGLAS